MGSEIVTILVILVIAFLIFREVVCWYWKINKQVQLLEEIRDLLDENISKGKKEFEIIINKQKEE